MMRFVPLLLALVLTGCATPPLYEEAARLSLEGKPEEAVVRLERLVAENPRNAQYRAALLREKERAVGVRVVRGDAFLREGKVDDAEREYGAARGLDPTNARIEARLRDAVRARRHQTQVLEAKALVDAPKPDLAGAERLLRGVLAEAPNHAGARELLRRVLETTLAVDTSPQLKAPFAKPVTLEFRDAPIRTVFDLLSRTSGINFVFDRDVRQDTKLSVFLRNSSLEDALKLVLTTNQLDRKVLNENSVVIYPNTPAKQKDYRELVVRSFYLANTDVKQASAMVKSMVKTQDVFIDEKLNLLVIKDTPEVIRLAEQLVRTLDVAEPEVMLEVEVLEVTRSRLQQLGVDWPKSVSLGARTATGTTASGTQPIDGPMIFSIANPAITFNLNASVSGTNLLANPRIRAKNKEKARIHIGDKVPVFTSTATANVGVSTSVTYLDVGLKLDVEPQVYLNDEVAIKIGLAVDNIVEEKTVSTGTGSTIAYRIGTRNTNTVLQLKDGETQILAGLINDEDRRSSSRIPGLGDLPVLSRIFGTQTDNKVKTEIVLLITPRIVRNILRPEGSMPELPVGTDSTPGLPPLRIGKTAAGAVAVGGTSAGTAAAGPVTPPADALPPPAGFQLRMNAPAQVRPGARFAVTLLLPDGVEIRDGFVEIAFDPAVVQPVNAPAQQPGRVQLPADRFARGSAEITFRVAGEAGASTLLAVSNAEFIDVSGFAVGVAPPPPVSVSVAR